MIWNTCTPNLNICSTCIYSHVQRESQPVVYTSLLSLASGWVGVQTLNCARPYHSNTTPPHILITHPFLLSFMTQRYAPAQLQSARLCRPPLLLSPGPCWEETSYSLPTPTAPLRPLYLPLLLLLPRANAGPFLALAEVQESACPYSPPHSPGWAGMSVFVMQRGVRLPDKTDSCILEQINTNGYVQLYIIYQHLVCIYPSIQQS